MAHGRPLNWATVWIRLTNGIARGAWQCFAGGMKREAGEQLLKGVSRSFYLSLRLLPAAMRGAASLGYLLARTSDTLADTAGAPVEARLWCLDRFERAVAGEEKVPRWPLPVINAVADVRERWLLEGTVDLLGWLGRLPEGEAGLVREVVATITGGQRLDLERFASAGGGKPVALADDGELEDYAWRVAGCVGAFWTRLGFETLGARFSREQPEVLLEKGIAYGKGLQLVNILRDLPSDLEAGRCYLPVADPGDLDQLMSGRNRWIDRAAAWVGEGHAYAAVLGSRRLRAASVLPAMLAEATLERLKHADWEAMRARVKVPRRWVYLALVRALAGKV